MKSFDIPLSGHLYRATVSVLIINEKYPCFLAYLHACYFKTLLYCSYDPKTSKYKTGVSSICKSNNFKNYSILTVPLRCFCCFLRYYPQPEPRGGMVSQVRFSVPYNTMKSVFCIQGAMVLILPQYKDQGSGAWLSAGLNLLKVRESLIVIQMVQARKCVLTDTAHICKHSACLHTQNVLIML